MKELKRILFPIDLSEVSPKIAPWVLLTAKKFQAEIHLLFVARNLEHLTNVNVQVASIENFQSEIIEGAETKIEKFANTYFEGYPVCKAKVVVGDAAEEILNYIGSAKIDLVIIGTHGRKGMDRIILGSIADKVIKSAPVPVLSVNPNIPLENETDKKTNKEV